MWPQVHVLKQGVQVICSDCSRISYGISEEEDLYVWVRVAEEKPAVKKPPAKPRVKTVRCSICSKTGHTYTACPLMTEAMV